MKSKLVKESLSEYLNESARTIFPQIISSLKELGYKFIQPDSGTLSFSKFINDGELSIYITERAKTSFKDGMLQGNPNEVDQDMLTISAAWSPNKKILGKYRSPNYKSFKYVNDLEEMDFGSGIFSMSDSNIIEKIKEKILEIENKI